MTEGLVFLISVEKLIWDVDWKKLKIDWKKTEVK